MLERMIENTRELNRVANHMRARREFDRIRKLADEWMVPGSYAENFIAGKRSCLADLDIGEKNYKNANEKLAEEMYLLEDAEFADVIGVYLCRKCRNREYAAKLLQNHKTLQKCLDYVLDKAYSLVEQKRKDHGRKENRMGMAVGDALVFQWVDEYYALDDEKKELEKREEAKAKYLEAKKKKESQKKKKEEREAKQKERQKKKEEKEKKKKEAAQNVQLTFDFLGGGESADTEQQMAV